MSNIHYDPLDGWRDEVNIKNSKGEVRRYAGGSEYDPTAEAIMAYEREQARHARETAKNTQKDLGEGR